MTISQVLLNLEHPYFSRAKIDFDSIYWILKCPTCGTRHKIFTYTIELDSCCDNTPIPNLN